MRVKDVISILSKIDPDTEVWLDAGDGYAGVIAKVDISPVPSYEGVEQDFPAVDEDNVPVDSKGNAIHVCVFKLYNYL